MSIEIKVSCPLCTFVHMQGTPGRPVMPDGPELPEFTILNYDRKGLFKVYEVPFEDFPGRERTNLDAIEKRFLVNYLEQAEKLQEILEERIEELE